VTEEPRLPSPDEQPRVSRISHILAWILWFGIPSVLVAIGLFLISTGFPAAVLLIFFPFVVGLPALALLARRHGANLVSWDDERIVLRCAGGETHVFWSDIAWFQKLWATHKLEGGGKAWIATLVNYRARAGRHKTVLLTVSGSAGEKALSSSPFPLRSTRRFST
jgi:hypothetical protein